jgi:hypothetical protein
MLPCMHTGESWCLPTRDAFLTQWLMKIHWEFSVVDYAIMIQWVEISQSICSLWVMEISNDRKVSFCFFCRDRVSTWMVCHSASSAGTESAWWCVILLLLQGQSQHMDCVSFCFFCRDRVSLMVCKICTRSFRWSSWSSWSTQNPALPSQA